MTDILGKTVDLAPASWLVFGRLSALAAPEVRGTSRYPETIPF
jgi:hypothetical protein